MIKIKDVTFQYARSKENALNNVSLQIRKGDFTGIIGTSGAGKSTLALAMAGLIPKEVSGDFYGSITVDGKDSIDTPSEELYQKMGLVFQDIDSQMVSSIVEDEILFGLENFGVSHEAIGKRIERVLKELGIEELKTREISSLSGGQKQKVAIAAILAMEPEIIILDEPTGELDPESSREIFQMLKKMNREKGITIVIIEQKIMLLSEFCSNLVVMEKGCIRLEGEPRKVIHQVETFKELGINVPPVAELSYLLAKDGLYQGDITMNVDEAEKMVKEVLKQ